MRKLFRRLQIVRKINEYNTYYKNNKSPCVNRLNVPLNMQGICTDVFLYY